MLKNLAVALLLGMFSIEAVAALGLPAHARGNSEEEAHSLLLANSPDDVQAYIDQGNAYAEAGQHEQALAACNQALELNPQSAMAYYRRAYLFQSVGQYEDAIADFTRAAEIDPHHAIYGDRAIAYMTIYQSKQSFAQNSLSPYVAQEAEEIITLAIADFDRAVELAPEDAANYSNRGLAYKILGQYERAIEDYNQAIQLNPEYTGAYFGRGNAYQELSDHVSAIADYDRALELSPQNYQTYYNRGLSYLELGNVAQAQADWEQTVYLAEQQNDRDSALKAQGQLQRMIPMTAEERIERNRRRRECEEQIGIPVPNC